MCSGPSKVPRAANSFTSPAPVAPTKCPGSISTNPTANPASAPATETPVTCNAANARPSAVIASVSWFGTRRVFKSTSAPTPPLVATTATKMASDALSNGLPEPRVNRVADRPDRRERHDRDERRQQPVFDQVLALVAAPNQSHNEETHPVHGSLSKERGGTEVPPLEVLRRRRELVRDRGEDLLHAAAGRRHRGNRDERDQRDEQRVLEQVLALVVAHERTQTVHEFHDASSRRVPRRAIPCVRNAITLRCAIAVA